ncbi:hypothetical protein OF83DRAFT_29217 [Amylostereum chailletii]|nr:hypothetical protein OF83DRAFT_29217 [Amylostereum chailletii]
MERGADRRAHTSIDRCCKHEAGGWSMPGIWGGLRVQTFPEGLEGDVKQGGWRREPPADPESIGKPSLPSLQRRALPHLYRTGLFARRRPRSTVPASAWRWKCLSSREFQLEGLRRLAVAGQAFPFPAGIRRRGIVLASVGIGTEENEAETPLGGCRFAVCRMSVIIALSAQPARTNADQHGVTKVTCIMWGLEKDEMQAGVSSGFPGYACGANELGTAAAWNEMQ